MNKCEVCGKNTNDKMRAVIGPWHYLCEKHGIEVVDNLSEDNDVGLASSWAMLNVSDLDLRGAIMDMRGNLTPKDTSDALPVQYVRGRSKLFKD